MANSGIPNDIPVLLTIFNRPDKTKRVIENLRQIKPSRLFVAADGPSKNFAPDLENCQLARREIAAVDWSCEVRTRYLDHNLGCDPSVSTAIDWFFQQVECGIILEDDCLVHPDFFRFCAELFERYADDLRIMQISSLSPYAARQHPHDYHFSRMFRCSGGWGTWRRAWKHFNSDLRQYSDQEAMGLLKAYYPDQANCLQWYRKLLEFKRGTFNNWDFQWNIACYAQNGLSVVPERNLMLNIGFGDDSTHTTRMNPVFDNLKMEPLPFPLRHPPFVYADSLPERSLELKIYRDLPVKSRCMYLLRKARGTTAHLREILPFG